MRIDVYGEENCRCRCCLDLLDLFGKKDQHLEEGVKVLLQTEVVEALGSACRDTKVRRMPIKHPKLLQSKHRVLYILQQRKMYLPNLANNLCSRCRTRSHMSSCWHIRTTT